MLNVLKPNKTQDQLEHITQEMYKRNLELAERNKTLMILRKIDEVVLNSKSNSLVVAQSIADLLTKEATFNLCMIFIKNTDSTLVTLHGASAIARNPEIESIFSNNFRSINISLPESGVFYDVIGKGETVLINSFKAISPNLADEVDQSLRVDLATNSLFVCPLQSNGRLIGILVLGQPLDEEGAEFQKSLVDRLTGTISVAIENQILYEELQTASARLQVQNAKLIELDKTKDEFISMASHQLRTPLTTIKGYLSMIIDGDTGPLRDSQKDMVQRAFDSANKMVYLIADMLNVSRLQTGKFVIDNKPLNLADVVESEVAQMQTTAKDHQVILTYTKPSAYPTLSLDETKIRQVIMNFIDNAVYYTPKGGRVTVALQANDKQAIFTVTDTGVGVPAQLQANLFTKFYRADNAKKVRPDGTGLGLYMAKKVIVAEGGTILFKSTEGKGSVFGFSFPLQPLTR